ncbi:MAG: hypothetical protein ACUVX8_02760 [Candidatus Zipacnadales bacterium]
MLTRTLLSTAFSLLAGSMLLALLVSLKGQGDVAAIGLLMLMSTAVWLLLRYLVPDRDEARVLWWIVLGGILARFFLSVFQDYVWPELGRSLKADALACTAIGRRLAEAWHMGLAHFQLPDSLSHLHDWLTLHRTAILYYYFGESPLLPESTNNVLGASAAVACYMIVRRWSTVEAARIAALLAAFWPSLMVWSSHNLKDPVSLATLCWSALGILILRDRFSVIGLLIVAFSWVLSFLIRPYMGMMTITGELAAVGLLAVRSRTLLASSAALTVTVIMGSVVSWAGYRQVQQMYGEQASVKGAEEKRETFYEEAVEARQRGERHSEYVINIESDTPLESILLLPLRIPLFMISPIPVRLGTTRLMATYPEMMFLYWLVPKFILGLGLVWRRTKAEAVFVLSALGPILVAFSIGTSISGEAMRYRDIFLPLWLCFAAVGWAAQRETRRAVGRVTLRFREPASEQQLEKVA